MKEKYLRKIDRLEDKASQEELKIDKLQMEHKSKKTEEFVSAGESILGFLMGSKSRRGLSSAARKRRSTSSAKKRIKMRVGGPGGVGWGWGGGLYIYRK